MAAQLVIDFDPRAHARRTDPATSKDAAQRARELAASHCQKILDALKAKGPMGVDRIARATGLERQQVNKRLPDLQKQGFADVLPGQTELSDSGRPQRIWVAKKK